MPSISFIFVLTKTIAIPPLSSMVYESQLVGKVSSKIMYICKRLSLLHRQGSKMSELFLLQTLIPQIHLPHNTYSLAVILINKSRNDRNNSELLTTTPTYPASTSFNSTTFLSPWATMLFFLLHLCPYENNSNSTAFINGVICNESQLVGKVSPKIMYICERL